MKISIKIALAAVTLFVSLFAYGQATWYPVTLNTTTYVNGINVLSAMGGATVQFCGAPANATPCTNYATVYTDSTATTPCNGSNGCSNPATADSNGNSGEWFLPGQYDYTFTYKGQSFGPYHITIQASPNVQYISPGLSQSSIQAIIDAAASANQLVYFPAGTYSVVNAVHISNEFDFYGAFQIHSNTHIECDRGATFQLAANQSTDAFPKDISMFVSGTAVSNVSMRGCTVDMNYPNNKISPNRGVSYNAYNFAHVRVSGTNAAITDADFEYNTFLNTPGATCLALGQSNSAGSLLSDRIVVAHNLFKNNGMDTSDFSCVYAWGNHVDIHDNVFTQDSAAPTESPFVGTFMAFEIHGHDSTFHDNRVVNYGGGGYVANNYTSLVYNVDVHNNELQTTWQGVKLFNSGGNSQGVSDVKIHDNVLSFVEHAYTSSPNREVAFDISPALAVNNIDISNNHVSKSGVQTIPAEMALITPATGQPYNGIRFYGNTAINLAQGIVFDTTIGGGLGYIEVSDNHFYNFAPVGILNVPIGVSINATNTIKTVKLANNSFIDEQGVPTFQDGIYLNAGTITDLYLGPQVYKGLTVQGYTETGGITVTNRLASTVGGKFTANGGLDANSAGIGHAGAISGITSSSFTSLLCSSTAPTISSGFGTSPSIPNNNGTCAFTVNVGTGGTATNGVIGLPAAAHGWSCEVKDLTTQSSTVFVTRQIATSTTSATVANFNTAGAQAAWVASDVLALSCHAY